MNQHQLLAALRTMDALIEQRRAARARTEQASPLSRVPMTTQSALRRGVMLPLLLIIVLLLALVATTNASPAGSAAEEATPAASAANAASGDFSGLVDIGGRSLYLRCSGEGSPTVLLEAGGNGTPSRTWWADSPVQAGIAEYTRVCSYDRANTFGQSDPAPLPRTGTEIVNDLHALLNVAKVPGPYVMVAASTGGLISRLYASLYPDEVAGMVLLDTVHEDLDARYAEILSYDLFRAYAEMSGDEVDPEGIWVQGYLSDAIEYEVMSAQAASPIRLMPLVVITIDHAFVPADFPPGWPADADNAMWRAMQQAQANLVPGGRLIVAENSGHNIHFDQPQMVIDTVREVVDAVHDPSAWDAAATTPSATPAAGGEEVASADTGDFADLVDIGGRSLYLQCQGAGSPTVILEAGLDTSSETWSSLMPEVAKLSRVCAYDRANLGASDSAPQPRTGQDVVSDLHALLQAADVPGPYVLVAASYGGIHDRLFAHTYPDEVAGLVLLDPTHEDEDAHLAEALGPDLWGELVDQGWLDSGEGIDFALTSAQVKKARAELPLPAVPVVLLSAGRPSEPLPMPDWPSERVDPALLALQEDLATLVPGQRWIVVENSGHNIHFDQPDAVVDAIRDVVEAVRDPSTWEAPAASP